MGTLIDAIIRVSRKGPLRYFVHWPLLGILIIKQKIDSHYYDLMSDAEKREAIVRWGQSCGCEIVVESGTFMGWTAEYVSKYFGRYITIELDPIFYRKAVDKFKDTKSVEVILGNSGDVLPGLMGKLDRRTLFYLDGHYCGHNTAKGNSNTPIIQEIMTILGHADKNHVILIDDARMFLGCDGYPSIRALRKMVNRIAKDYELRVSDDIIKIYNPACHDHARRW